MEKWKLPIILPMSRQNFKFTFAGHAVTVYFYLYSNFQEIATPNAKHECTSSLSFSNNFASYINSQQKINTAIYIHWTSTANSHTGPSYLNAISDAYITRKKRHVKCSCRLLKIAQTTQNKHVTGNAIVAMATLTLSKRLLLGVAAWHDFCVKWVLHFCKFLANPTSISNLTISSERQWTYVPNDILSVWKYCQLSMHESKTFLLKHAIQSN